MIIHSNLKKSGENLEETKNAAIPIPKRKIYPAIEQANEESGLKIDGVMLLAMHSEFNCGQSGTR